MIRRRLAALLVAVVAACSDEPAPEAEAAADDVRMAVFLAQGRELWRERVGQTLHVLYEPGPGSDLHGRLCTGTVVIPLGWEGRRIGQSCALPPVPHVSAARSGRSNEVWGLATAAVAAVEVRSSEGVATARLVDASGRRWWVAAVPGEATDLGVVARDAAGRVLQDLAFVT